MVLKIRAEQMAVFEKVMRRRFEDRMVAHIARTFPDRYHEMLDAKGGNAPVRQFVWDGVKRAGAYGITTEGNVQMFLDLLLGLGADFDARSDTAWTREALDPPDLTEDEKMGIIRRELDARSGGRGTPWAQEGRA